MKILKTVFRIPYIAFRKRQFCGIRTTTYEILNLIPVRSFIPSDGREEWGNRYCPPSIRWRAAKKGRANYYSPHSGLYNYPGLVPIPGRGREEWEYGLPPLMRWRTRRANTRTSHSAIHIFPDLQPIPGRDRDKWECRLITDTETNIFRYRANACTSHSAIINTVLRYSLKAESLKNNKQGVR